MKKLIYLSFATLLIAACSKDKNNNPVTNAQEAAKDKDLQLKTFVSDCSIKPLEALLTGIFSGGQSSVKGQRVAYRFEGANVTRTTRLFNTADCSGDAAFTFEELGTIKIDKNQKTNDGGYNIDLDYNKVKVAMATDAGRVAANAIKMCGAADWAAKQTRDVTAQAKDVGCYGAALPRHISNIYRVDAKTLFMGTQSKGSNTARERPSSLNMSDKYIAP